MSLRDGEHILGGRRMRLVENGEHTTIDFDDKGTGRVCGACQLCCKLMPVRTLDKPANTRCAHQKVAKGCTIYANAPIDCQAFSCRWLADVSTTMLPRPDRAHYVIDLAFDTIRLISAAGEEQRLSVLQIWCDPAFPEAHQAPELRAYLALMAERHGLAALVRYGASEAFAILSPAFSSDGKWQETDRKTAIMDGSARRGAYGRGPLHLAE